MSQTGKELTEAFKAQYPKYYGRFYAQRPPDFTKCAGSVSGDRLGSRQCSKKHGHGQEGAWCKMHDPVAVKAKNRAWHDAFNAKYAREAAMSAARAALEPALRKIAEGHNDAQSLAREVIAALDAAKEPT